MRQITATLFASLVILAGCGRKHESPLAELPAVKAQTVKVEIQSVPEINEVVGTVRPKVSATVAAQVTATIEQVYVKAGDPIGAGQPLAKLDDRDLRAEFERAKTDFDRFRTLLEQQAATKAEFEAVQSRYRVAEAALSHTSLTAPFDGIVTRKLCDAGDLATPGKALFELEQQGAFRLEANVPERFSGAVGVGKSVHVLVEATGEKCTGTISEVMPVADPATRSFLIKVDLNCQKPLRTGTFGRAQLLIGERISLFVTKASVHERGQLTYVFVVSEGRARMRLVKTGRAYLGAVEILSGLQAGETIVSGSDGELQDGQRIEVK